MNRGTSSKDVQLLQQIVDLEKTHQLAPLPNVQDPPKINLNPNKVYTFQRTNTLASTDWVISVPSPTTKGLSFKLSDVDPSSFLANTFEEWKLAQVTVKFIPLVSLTSFPYPPVCTVIDYVSLPTSNIPFDDLKNYSTYRSHPVGVYAERTLTPCYFVDSYDDDESDDVTTPSSTSSAWCSTGTPDVEWIGLRFGVPAPPSSSSTDTVTNIFQVEIDYILNFRGTR
jgi:hypothetical protein